MSCPAQQEMFTTQAFERFMAFHRANPEVYRLFVKYARQALEAGYRHYSARQIMERVRWQAEIKTKGDSFKINNNHIPYYAKMLMESLPEFKGFFQTRQRRAA